MWTGQTDRRPLATGTVRPSESAGIVVCETVSRATATPIEELPPLGRTIDPDAIDELFADETSRGSILFRYAGHDVVVTADGSVEVFEETTLTA